MTGKPLNEFQLGILKRLLQIQKLTNQDIAFVLDCDERTIRRRRYEFAATGNLAKKRDVGKNAEKLKPEHLEKLREWLKTHDDAPLLEDCQLFLKTHFDLHVSLQTISRQLRRASGRFRPNSKVRRDAEGRILALSSLAAGTTNQENQPGQGEQCQRHEEARFGVLNGC
ncbi:hypothetical protein B0T16DRAFT_398415 [Cercophora newfieldiana]|uniref:Uncharacterized protein n=1 Tax=Cercophora newfieldiana TaxID=92897 RepID=A0AA39YNZ1_9PEZI|nr:hypothetical protein B0T16DRAFT_398415 [Cercophora newfieldiana]